MGLLRVIKKEDHNSAKIVQILNTNKQIKFVSLMGIDLGGNATDEKIPVELFKKDINDFLYRGVQTDGSSVELHEIAVIPFFLTVSFQVAANLLMCQPLIPDLCC